MTFTMEIIITCRLTLITCFKILNHRVKKLWILIKSDPKSHLLGHANAQVFKNSENTILFPTFELVTMPISNKFGPSFQKL